jgi:protein-S-isoprenylcysteine O-methyltransferase Ste14
MRWIEEPFLIARYGEAFRRYASHTSRFVPRFGLLSAR